MNVLSVNSLAPAALTAVNPLWAAKLTAPSDTSTLTYKDLAKELFQQTLQSTTLSPLAEPTMGGTRLAQQATSSLLAALTVPPAAADTAPTPNTITNPFVVNTLASSSSAATPVTAIPSTTLPTPVVNDLPMAQDTFANSATGDFAMQTALRFGAGVTGPAAPVQSSSEQGTGLVRDATAVLRTGTVQAHAGGPGPEAFLQTQTYTTRILREYQTVSAPQPPIGLDLLA